MSDIFQHVLIGLALGLGWLILVSVTSYLWTAMRILSDNSMTKNKKVCDICFRDIKKWHEAYKSAQPQLSKPKSKKS